jgi:predicted outer membrane protein
VALTVCYTSSAAAQGSAKLDDPTIVAIFDAANTYDIETGSLAAKKVTTPTVRDFGKMLVRDHKLTATERKPFSTSSPPQLCSRSP